MLRLHDRLLGASERVSMQLMSSIERLIRRAGGPNAVSTVLDVGAHDGADSLPLAERYPDLRFVAIEPTPDLAEALRHKSAHLSNYTVVEAAVATEEGSRALNVFAARPDLNSLNQLRSSAASVAGLQSPEPDARHLVPAKRLSTICDELAIPSIDVIHIDTQGSDLDVLHSLDARRLLSISAGEIEVSYRVHLYDTSEDGRQARSALEQMGFRVFRIERLHYAFELEHNYYFVRRSGRHPPRVINEVAFKSHLVACEARAVLGRYLLHPAQRVRVALGIRTRLKSLRHA